jgi:hypothetical protein
MPLHMADPLALLLLRANVLCSVTHMALAPLAMETLATMVSLVVSLHTDNLAMVLLATVRPAMAVLLATVTRLEVTLRKRVTRTRKTRIKVTRLQNWPPLVSEVPLLVPGSATS